MATFRAISAVGHAVLDVLTDAWARDPFTDDTFETTLLGPSAETTAPFAFGVSLHAIRIAVNGVQRTSPPTVPGRRRPLPVDLELMVVPWAISVQRELELIGWCMRALDDEPIITASTLNRTVPGVFAPNEFVELIPSTLTLDEQLRMWDAWPWDQRLAVTYTARVLRLESARAVTEAGPVLERDLAFAAGAPS